MNKNHSVNRRRFLELVTASAAVSTVASTAAQPNAPIKIIGFACSMRPGKTTAQAVQIALEAAKSISPDRIQTELIDLAGKDIFSGLLGKPDQFETIVPKLKDPHLKGLIIGSPTYFRSLSGVCKVFLDRLIALRKPTLLLKDKVVGAVAVGGNRNGGQELVITQIHAAMLSHETYIVGGKAPHMLGAILWNNGNDDITQDELGVASAKHLGSRVAEACIKLAGAES